MSPPRENSRRESREKGMSYTHDSVYTKIVASSGGASQRTQYYEARAAQAENKFEQKFHGQGEPQ